MQRSARDRDTRACRNGVGVLVDLIDVKPADDSQTARNRDLQRYPRLGVPRARPTAGACRLDNPDAETQLV